MGARAGLASASWRHRRVHRRHLAGRAGGPPGRHQAARGDHGRGSGRAERAGPRGVLAPRGRRAADRSHRGDAGAASGRRPPWRRTPTASRSPGSGSRTLRSAGCSWRWPSGRFAGSDLPRPRFLARQQLRDRMARVERRGGWPTLARTTVADVADHLWERRVTHARPGGRRFRRCRSTATPRRRTCPAATATRCSPSTGARSAPARPAVTSATTRWLRASRSSRCSTPT